MFKEIAGSDDDAGMLLTKALTKAKKRVVVKRPVKSGYLKDMKPSHSLTGKSCRFDVYMLH